MNRIDIEAKVKNILNEQLGVDDDKIKTSSSLCNDLNADSLDIIEIIMACEEEFDVELDDAEMDNVDITYQELVTMIEKKVA